MNIYSLITDHFIKKGYINAEDRDIYIYGFDIIAYTVWSTAFLLLIGIFFHQFMSALIIITLFYTFQSFGGGYHAHSHLQCLLGMTLGLIAGLSFVLFKNNTTMLWMLMTIGILLLTFIPLVLHPNKAFLAQNKKS